MPKHFYPGMIISLLGAFILFLLWSAFQASTQGTQVTDRDYYSKGLKYNSTQVEKRAAASQGWQLATELIDGQLLFKLQDGIGQPVSGAKGVMNLYSRPDSDLLTIPMLEIATGEYRAILPVGIKGEMTLRVEFEHDGARLNRQLLITL